MSAEASATLSPEQTAGLAERWQKARLAAIEKSLQEKGGDEMQLLRKLGEQGRDAVLLDVFENSRKLGRSFAKHFSLVLERDDLRALLPNLQVGCLKGDWYQRDASLIRERVGCMDGLKLGSYVCDYFREAIDGLTLGLTDDVLFARHASCRHSDDRCLDVWFDENRGQNQQQSRLGLPEWATPKLKEIEDALREQNIDVVFEEVREGTLYCRISSAAKPSCVDQGSSDLIVARAVSKIWPGVSIKNTTPVAVYGERKSSG